MFLYSVVIRLYIFLIYLVSPFHLKARKLINGRRHFFKNHSCEKNDNFIWFHCASLGEFEQGRPLIEKLKKEHPDQKILLSFFSSSGYEIRKKYPFADKVIYLPFDTHKNANMFLGTFNIKLAVFVKLDLWPNYIHEILDRKIPVILTSAVFRQQHFYFKWYGSFILKKLKRFNKIFVQNEESLHLLNKHGFNNVLQAGDVRIDRVIEIKSGNENVDEIVHFSEGTDCIVFGSVYKEEIPLIQSVLKSSHHKIIIAPHDINTANLQVFLNKVEDVILFSNLKNFSGQKVLLVDNVGMLNKIYKYALMAYVGGGFGKQGIHNILEPAVWGIPVYIGPNYKKFPEAISMVEKKLAYSFDQLSETGKQMSIRSKDLNKSGFKNLSTEWFEINAGATNLIYSHLDVFI